MPKKEELRITVPQSERGLKAQLKKEAKKFKPEKDLTTYVIDILVNRKKKQVKYVEIISNRKK